MTDNEIKEYLIKNYKTIANTELAKACDIKMCRLYKEFKTLGISKKPQKLWTKEEDQILIIMWDKHSKSDILKTFPTRSYKSLVSRASTIGCKKDKSTLSHNKLSILLEEKNENYYWLGFLMADGHFSKQNDIKLTLSEKDLSHVEKFAKLFGARVSKRGSCKYDRYIPKPSYCMAVRDVNTVKLLKEKYSISSNKTEYPCDISSFNTCEKFLSWFAGFFDGDGCALRNKKGKIEGLRVQIHSSWIKNLEFIERKLKEYLKVNSRSYIDTQGYARWVCFKDANIIVTKIQSLNLPILQRKLGLL